MRALLFTFFLLIALIYGTHAQERPDSVVMRGLATCDTIPTLSAKRWVFDSQIDQRNSFIPAGKSNSSLPIFGYTLGWTRWGRLRLGGGAYYASSNAGHGYLVKVTPDLQTLTPSSVVVNVHSNNYYLVQKKTQMIYITPSVEWIFFKSKWLDLSIPLEIGVGYSKIKLSDYFSGADIPIYNYRTKKTLPGNTIFFPALSGLSAMVNLTPDVGFQLGAGYRFILQEVGLSQDFDGLFYQFGAQLYPENFIKAFKKDYRDWKEKKRKRKNEKRLREAKKAE